MACILNIETATNVCSVTVSQGGEILFERIEYKGPSHAVLLAVYADEAIQELRAKGTKLDAIAVSCGPGSYTGLRIGVSQAKGLAYGLDIPLIAIPTLTIMAHSVAKMQNMGDTDLLCPMIDARRMEVYDCLFDKNMNLIRKVDADIIDENSFADILREKKIHFFGNGAEKCMDILKSENTVFVKDIHPLATEMVELAEKDFANNRFVDTAYFEPFYLKEFVATVAKNKVLPPLK